MLVTAPNRLFGSVAAESAAIEPMVKALVPLLNVTAPPAEVLFAPRMPTLLLDSSTLPPPELLTLTLHDALVPSTACDTVPEATSRTLPVPAAMALLIVSAP